MMTLNEIYKTNEIDGIPVTLLGIENLVATFQDIDGNEIEIQVDCRIESVPKNSRSRLYFPIAQLKGFKMIIRIEIKTVDGIKWERITGVGGTHESGIPCLVADIVARDFTNKGYAVDNVKWNFSQGLL